VFRGFSARLDRAKLRELQSDPDVAYVEPDSIVTADATTQFNAPWNLDRLDQHALPLNSTYTYATTGAGVTAYVIDTRIRATHGECGGRVGTGYDPVEGRPADDCNGHGTHVAGTLGGATYGVAKQVTLVPVRVLDCSGNSPTSRVIAGLDWVTADHA